MKWVSRMYFLLKKDVGVGHMTGPLTLSPSVFTKKVASQQHFFLSYSQNFNGFQNILLYENVNSEYIKKKEQGLYF